MAGEASEGSALSFSNAGADGLGFLREEDVRGRAPPGMQTERADGRADPTMAELLQHPESMQGPQMRPQTPAHPRLSRGESGASRDVRMIEASLLAKLDGRAGSDSDMSRAKVLTNLFGQVNPNGEQYASEPEFVQAIGRLGVGASHYAGVRGRNPHLMIPHGWKFDVRHDTLAALFDKYAERIGHERLVDVEGLYAKLKRSVTPHGCEGTSLEMRSEVEALERELADHPHAPPYRPPNRHGFASR